MYDVELKFSSSVGSIDINFIKHQVEVRYDLDNTILRYLQFDKLHVISSITESNNENELQSKLLKNITYQIQNLLDHLEMLTKPTVQNILNNYDIITARKTKKFLEETLEAINVLIETLDYLSA